MITNDDTFISDEEEEYCPLCVEEMDISDKNFKPCPCGYQICQFCYNNIRQNPELNGRCPGCRRMYDDESVEYKTISAEEYRLQQLKKEKREREKKQREKEKKETEMANKKHLAGLRVVQKNLVYVTGLNPPCNPDDLHSVLRSDRYFGQYGKISKIVINKKTPNPSSSHHHHQNPGLVVYVTFAKKDDALKCINELDGSLCDGRVLRAAHGTTKYCSSYLRGHPCPNPNCMFLHEPGEEADSYTRKDLSTQQGIKMSMMGMSGSRVGSSSNIQTSGVPNGTSASQHSGDEEGVNSQNDDESEDEQEQSDNNTSQTNQIPVLPATASWAKNSASASPSVTNNAGLANTASFPTLGEIFKDQKLQKKEKLKFKSSKSSKDNLLLPDDIDIDDNSAIDFAQETTDNLKSLFERKEKLDVSFKTTSTKDSQTLPLFSFDKNANFFNDSKIEDDRLVARQIIEKFVLRHLKNYHLAYQNHPITQQQSLVQAQIQQQQQQQQAQNSSSNIPNQPQLEQSEQQQQQLLLLQLQQQAHSQSARQFNAQSHSQIPAGNQNGTPSHMQAQMNFMKLNERSSNTSTPPPPGLFVAGGQKSTQPAAPNNNPYPSSITSTSNQSGSVNQSSSSQLLTQLMSGKR